MGNRETMRRRPLNISAALALAIERQVEDIIANAKSQCALRYAWEPIARANNESAEALLMGRAYGDFEPAIIAPRLDLWRRLRSLFAWGRGDQGRRQPT